MYLTTMCRNDILKSIFCSNILYSLYLQSLKFKTVCKIAVLQLQPNLNQIFEGYFPK